MVGAVCESDVEPGARSVGGVPPLAIGAQTGVPVNVSVQGRALTLPSVRGIIPRPETDRTENPVRSVRVAP